MFTGASLTASVYETKTSHFFIPYGKSQVFNILSITKPGGRWRVVKMDNQTVLPPTRLQTGRCILLYESEYKFWRLFSNTQPAQCETCWNNRYNYNNNNELKSIETTAIIALCVRKRLVEKFRVREKRADRARAARFEHNSQRNWSLLLLFHFCVNWVWPLSIILYTCVLRPRWQNTPFRTCTQWNDYNNLTMR